MRTANISVPRLRHASCAINSSGELFAANTLNRIATGHTLDDQAETVLLRIVRGAGTRGLAGIYPQLTYPEVINSQLLVPGSQFSVIRPLLATRRRAVEAYLRELGQDWREDSSNRDLRHARNRVRHGILPRLERTLNPAVRETLAETADVARAEEDYWQTEVARALPGCGRRSYELSVQADCVLCPWPCGDEW